jgi:transketolase
LLATLDATDVILVEPYAEGTSAAQVSSSLAHVPHRLLSVGVPPVELRRYGTSEEHQAAYGLDAAGLRGRFTAFLQM